MSFQLHRNAIFTLTTKPMAYPNPAGYYLPLLEAIEAEITELLFDDLKILNQELSELLVDVDIDFEASHLSTEANYFINSLNTDRLIDLIRWIVERLAYLYQQAHSQQ